MVTSYARGAPVLVVLEDRPSAWAIAYDIGRSLAIASLKDDHLFTHTTVEIVLIPAMVPHSFVPYSTRNQNLPLVKHLRHLLLIQDEASEQHDDHDPHLTPREDEHAPNEYDLRAKQHCADIMVASNGTLEVRFVPPTMNKEGLTFPSLLISRSSAVPVKNLSSREIHTKRQSQFSYEDVEWFAMVETSTFLVAHNLELMLREVQPSMTGPLLIRGPSPTASGAGLLLNRPALVRGGPFADKCEWMLLDGSGEVRLERCMEMAGVPTLVHAGLMGLPMVHRLSDPPLVTEAAYPISARKWLRDSTNLRVYDCIELALSRSPNAAHAPISWKQLVECTRDVPESQLEMVVGAPLSDDTATPATTRNPREEVDAEGLPKQESKRPSPRQGGLLRPTGTKIGRR